MAGEEGKVAVNELRDKLNFGRKLTVQLMEYFDRTGFYAVKAMIIFYVIKIHLIYRITHEKDIHFSLNFNCTFTVTGCEDKEAKAMIEQQTQTIAQLTAENTQLKAEKEKAEKVIPAIIAQDDVIFDKEETIKYPKSAKEDEYVSTEGKLHYSISTLKRILSG